MPNIAVIDVRIGKTVDDGVTPVTIQQRLRNVRTDLDQFSTTLVDMLVEHGLRVSRQALKDHGCEVRNSTLRRTESVADSKFLDREARTAAKRTLWLVNVRDWTTYILIAILVSGIALAGIIVWSALNSRKAKEAEEIALIDKAAASDQYRKRVDDLELENAELRKTLPPTKATTAPLNNNDYRVWIQFAGDIKREEMIKFGNQIKSKWENTPGAEQGGERTSNAAGLTEVRYGSPSDVGAAKRLTEDVLATGLVKKMNEPRIVHQIPPGSLEIWVSR